MYDPAGELDASVVRRDPDAVDAGDAGAAPRPSPSAPAPRGVREPGGAPPPNADPPTQAEVDAGAPREPAADDAGAAAPADARDAAVSVGDAGGASACTTSWVPAERGAAVPALAPSELAAEEGDGGRRRSYLCRAPGAAQPLSRIPGNAVGTAMMPAADQIALGCSISEASAPDAWQARELAAGFELLTVSPECTIRWISRTAGEPWPAGALETGSDASGAIYTCRARPDGLAENDRRLGRVSSAAGDACRISHGGGVFQTTTFDILAVSSP